MYHEVVGLESAICVSVLLTLVFNYYLLRLMSKALSVACLFELRVPPGFTTTAEGERILDRLRRLDMVGTVLAIVILVALFWLVHEPGTRDLVTKPVLIAFVLAYIVQGVFFDGAMHLSRKAAGRYNVEDGADCEPYPRGVRSLRVAQTSLPCSKALAVGQYVLFIMCGAYLALKWGSIPQRYPIQWSASVEVTRWADKSFLAAYWVLILATVSTTVLLGILNSIKSRIFAQNRTSERFRIVELLALIANVLIFVPMVLRSTWVPLKSAEPSVARFMLGLVAMTVFVTLVILVLLSRKKTATELGPITYRREEDLIRERNDRHYWKWDIFYYNPNDPALGVRKLLGGGVTVNMARKEAWRITWVGHFIAVFAVATPLSLLFLFILDSVL
ncbi:MAG TPA: DUF1648 domain-containing protein [Candidatus Bathyarchaeia archaeon]|nr:DUF1648 domain-containing protein [Candidatus Bathyarchaeia archaeon]